DGGATFTPPLTVGAPERRAARPYLFAQGDRVWLVWKEFDGQSSIVQLMSSTDDGATWSAPRVLASTADASDHPLLIGDRGKVYLSWLTRLEGYRLLPVGGPQ